MPLVDIPTQGGLICSWRSLLATKIQKTKLMLFLNYWWPIVFHCFRLEKLSASSTLNENISCFLFCLAAKYLLVNTHNQLIIRKPVWVAHSFEFPSALNGSVDPFSFDLLIVPYILSGGQPVALCSEQQGSASVVWSQWFTLYRYSRTRLKKWKSVGDQNKLTWIAPNREINNIPLWFSKHFTKWFMQISWSEACDKLATHWFCAFHPMHAATRSGPWMGEKMAGWIELIVGKKSNSTGKILTIRESKMLPSMNCKKCAVF